MAWYNSGTISVTNGSTAVTGTGTQFLANKVIPGCGISIGGVLYEVVSVASDTVLAIGPTYSGATTSSIAYRIFPTQARNEEMLEAVTNLASAVTGVNSTFTSGPTTLTSSKKLVLPASSTANAPLNISHGIAPTTPANGDIWTTSSGLFGRINGLTQQAITSAGGSITGALTAATLAAAATTISGALTVETASPLINLVENDQAVDEKRWRWNAASKTVFFQSVNDAQSTAVNAYAVSRGTGTAVDSHTFYTGAGAARLHINSVGNVGIGTSSPGFILDVAGSTSNSSRINVLRTGSSGVGAQLLSTGIVGGLAATNSGPLQLFTADAARVTVDATGNVGVGLATPLTTLHVLGSGRFSRNTVADSQAIEFVTDGTGNWIYSRSTLTAAKPLLLSATTDSASTSPSAGSVSIILATMGVNRWAVAQNGVLHPLGDNTYTLGTASARPSALYAASGTINTSDEREKAWRGVLSANELAAAREIAAEVGVYQWNSAITNKGADNARLHIGVKAQVVWSIMASHGLVDPIDDQGKPGKTPYAFLCYDEWTADAEMGIEAGNRYGVRPDELTMFLIAAQEQRLASLEALNAAA